MDLQCTKTLSLVLFLLLFLFFPKGNLHFWAPSTSSPLFNQRSSTSPDGLLPNGIDKDTCFSRFQFANYHPHRPRVAPSYLISKLREYERRHVRCGPHTASYNESVRTMSDSEVNEDGCDYLIWDGFNGLGNRMLSIASAFLYAVLTDRVFLTYQGNDMKRLFCEPFVNSSWVLPSDFPLYHKLRDPNFINSKSLGTLLNSSSMNTSGSSMHYLFIYLSYNYKDYDKRFYSDQNQAFVRKVPWLFLVSDQYFAPYLFTIESYKRELALLFPQKESTFHHLGRYLFHPSNEVWGLITRFYSAYLEKHDERIGLQIRIVEPKRSPNDLVMGRLLDCVNATEILPRFGDGISPDRESSSKGVLVTSLYPEYYEQLKEMYMRKGTLGGEVVGVYQPSHEMFQHFGDIDHNMKALAEIYLLSTCDVLLTSSWSTFGYVAHSLAGLKPWIFYVPLADDSSSVRQCRRAMSVEPCYHYPPYYDRDSGRMENVSTLESFHVHCEDVNWGVKLVDIENRERRLQ